MAAVVLAIVLLSSLYLVQISIARGPFALIESAQLMARSAAEWTAWAILLPFILGFAVRFPVGPDQPWRNFAVQLGACVLAMPTWAVLVAAPMSLLGLPTWGERVPDTFLDAAENGLLQRGGYLAIVYGLIVGFATVRRLAEERETAATRAEALRRELAAADLAQFTRLMGSDRLVERLSAVETAMARSMDDAERETLALAGELHESLARTRNLITP